MIEFDSYNYDDAHCNFALRFCQVNKDGKVISPLAKSEGNTEEVFTEAPGKSFYCETGIYAVGVHQWLGTGFVPYEKAMDIYPIFQLIDYSRDNLIEKVKEKIAANFGDSGLKILIRNLQKHFRSVVLKRGNILLTAHRPEFFFLALNMAYEYAKIKQEMNGITDKHFPTDSNFGFNPNIEKIINVILKYCTHEGHGIQHCVNVEANAMLLGKKFDVTVVRTFAYLHDILKKDIADKEHGPRAADFIEEWRYTLLSYLDDTQFGKLQDAIRYHTSLNRTNDPTINACFDADRLDLTRYGVVLDPERMATQLGWFHAKYGITEKDFINHRKISYIPNRCARYLLEIQKWHNQLIDDHEKAGKVL